MSKIDPRVETPALATRMSTEPSSSDHPVDEGDHGVEVAHVGHGRDAATPLGLDQADRLGQVIGSGQRVGHGGQVGAPVDQGDVGSLAGQFDGVAATLATGSAGDHRHPSGELPGPAVPCPSDAASATVPPPGSARPRGRLRGRDPGRDPTPSGPDRPQARSTSAVAPVPRGIGGPQPGAGPVVGQQLGGQQRVGLEVAQHGGRQREARGQVVRPHGRVGLPGPVTQQPARAAHPSRSHRRRGQRHRIRPSGAPV